ncbi:MAG: DUF899 family protein [Pseudomonadota bacterium]
MHDIRYPNESAQYRAARDELLQAEADLRRSIASVAAHRAALPPGGLAPEYRFQTSAGVRSLADCFGARDTLLVYSFMYGEDDQTPCPMCSAFLDSLRGHLRHIEQRMSVLIVARSPLERLLELAKARGWSDLAWASCAGNDYPRDYHSEMPNGAQVPMCNVFSHQDGEVRHFWASELFYVPSDQHPRHMDMLWPLWHFFDLAPAGRGEFMPSLDY